MLLLDMVNSINWNSWRWVCTPKWFEDWCTNSFNKQINSINERIDNLQEEINSKFDKVNERIDVLENKVDKIEQRIDNLVAKNNLKE